jgi:Holliday junction resolvasome RuvABC endonuclease subunit
VSESALILGMDPSSGASSGSATGLALLRVSAMGPHQLIDTAACMPAQNHPDALTERIQRIQETAGDIRDWIQRYGPVNAIGYEQPYMDPARKNHTYDALVMGCGAYLSAIWLAEGGRIYAVAANSAKAVYGAGGKKREAAKAMVCEWAKVVYPTVRGLDPVSLEAVADALAVAEVAAQKWRESQWAAGQQVLKMRGKVGVK